MSVSMNECLVELSRSTHYSRGGQAGPGRVTPLAEPERGSRSGRIGSAHEAVIARLLYPAAPRLSGSRAVRFGIAVSHNAP
jgi:hypothetical protein